MTGYSERERVKSKAEREAVYQAIESIRKKQANDPAVENVNDHKRGLNGGWNRKGDAYREGYDRIFKQ